MSESCRCFSRHVVMPQLAGFLDAYPNLRIEFHTRRKTTRAPSRLIARKLGQGRPAAYASPTYIARHGELKDPDHACRE